MLQLHKTIVKARLEETLRMSRGLQSSIKEFHDRVPNGLFILFTYVYTRKSLMVTFNFF